jgi:hypothetical protein
MKILTLFVRYGAEAYPNAEKELGEFYERLKGVETRILILDNAVGSPDQAVDDPRFELVPGDNSSWEFSAWDQGLHLAGSEIWRYDLVHLVTSAFNTLYTAYIPRITAAMLKWASERPVCLGHIDCFNEPIRLLSYVSQHWTRSCFLFLRPAELKALGSLVTVNRGSGFFSGDPLAPFAPTAPLSANLQKNIISWLTGADIGQGVRWHSAFQLSPERLRYFEDKSLSILNEHLLSVRLRAMGCACIDVTWLHGRLAATRNPPCNVRWLQQLRERPADAVAFAAPGAG